MSELLEWLPTVLLSIPLFGLAGSAVAYVVKFYQDVDERRRKHFFELMAHLDGPGPIAQKLTAIYALRDFKEHYVFIERFCETLKHLVTGPSSQAIINEFEHTLLTIRKTG